MQKKETDDSRGWWKRGDPEVIFSTNLLSKVSFLHPTEPVQGGQLSKKRDEDEDGLEVMSDEEDDVRNPRYSIYEHSNDLSS